MLETWEIWQISPFWLKEDEKKLSQHLFLYELESSSLKPKWMSSYMGFVAASMDFDAEGRFHFRDEGGEESVWEWFDFGVGKVE